MSKRTFLFAPGSDKRKAEKALTSAADIVILDLEDAVAPSEKDNARVSVTELAAANQGRQLLVRINALSTPWALQDLLAVLPSKPLGIVLPKAESEEDIKKVSWVISQVNGSDSKMGIYPLIESAAGVEEAVKIAKASPRVKQLIFGAMDYTADLGLNYTPDPAVLAYARARIVGASANAGLEGPVDTVYPGIKDDEGLRQDTLEGKKVGCKGKLVIHPAQIDIVNSFYAPSAEEIEEARQILEVYHKAQAEGKGAVQWKGKMMDAPVLKRAQQIIQQIEE